MTKKPVKIKEVWKQEVEEAVKLFANKEDLTKALIEHLEEVYLTTVKFIALGTVVGLIVGYVFGKFL